MNKSLKVIQNTTILVCMCFMLFSCQFKNKTEVLKEGYVNEVDTLYDSNTLMVSAIERTFYRKLPTIHNGLIEMKQPDGESYIIVVVNGEKGGDFSLFVIEDLFEFLEKTKQVIKSNKQDITINIDDLKSTYIRKSITFKNGIFFSKEINNTPAIVFDLSNQDLKDIETAYHLFLSE